MIFLMDRKKKAYVTVALPSLSLPQNWSHRTTGKPGCSFALGVTRVAMNLTQNQCELLSVVSSAGIVGFVFRDGYGFSCSVDEFGDVMVYPINDNTIWALTSKGSVLTLVQHGMKPYDICAEALRMWLEKHGQKSKIFDEQKSS